MLYLGLAFSSLFLLVFFYLIVLDLQIKDIKRRLAARITSHSE